LISNRVYKGETLFRNAIPGVPREFFGWDFPAFGFAPRVDLTWGEGQMLLADCHVLCRSCRLQRANVWTNWHM